MNTMQLACFTEVASTLSFSQAANNLHVSQPTVSHQIKSLEDELGCQLLARSTRSVSLTDEGFALIGYAHDILELSERARRRVAGAEVVSAKTLRIGVNDGIEAQALSPVLPCAVGAAYLRRYARRVRSETGIGAKAAS